MLSAHGLILCHFLVQDESKWPVLLNLCHRTVQDEREAMLAAARKAGSQHQNGESVSAAEMAQTLSSAHNNQAGSVQKERNSASKGRMPGSRHIESMREGKQKQHKTDSNQPKSGLKRKRKPRPKF